MKKVVSLVLAAVLVLSSVLPAFSQKRLVAIEKQGKKQSLAQPESTRFASFSAYTDGGGVWLSWKMEAEIGNIGFRVYRIGKEGAELLSPAKFVGGAAIHGRELPSYGETYGYFDAAGDGNSPYYVEAFGLDGKKHRTAEIYPEYAGSLKALTGMSDVELAARGEAVESPNGDKSILTFTKDIVSEMQETAPLADPVQHKIVISTPGAVRIGVKTEGICRVTRAQLEAAGFDAGSDSTKWQLYLEGVEQSIIVGNNAEYIEFYGKAVDTNETDVRRYYLIPGSTPGKRIESRVATRQGSTVVTPSYLQTFVKKERTEWVDDIINDDVDNYFGRGVGSTASNINLNLTGIDFTPANSRLYVSLQGYSSTAHNVEIKLNDHLIGNLISPFAGEYNFSGTYDFPTSFLLEGTNVLSLRSTANPADFSFFDTVTIDFSRKYLAEQNKLNFYTQNYRAARLDGFGSANVRVFDITREGSPVLMTNLDFQQQGPTFGVEMPAARGRAFFAVEDTAISSPESVTANDPELYGGAAPGADLVIITHQNFLAEAQTWANYRIGQGVSTKVIVVDNLYDEYSYGTIGSAAIKSFLQDAFTNWINKPDWVMLIGDGSWDGRNREGLGNFNFVPPKIVSTVYTDTASDEALADFNNDGLAEMAIGRIAARTPAQVTTVFNKTVAWEARVQAGNIMNRGALFAYDVDNTYPFAQMSTNLRNQIPGVPATMIQRGAGSDVLLKNAMGAPLAEPDWVARGRYIVNYSGHGSAGSWNSDFFTVFSVPQTVDHSPAIYTMLTCLNGYFHWLYNPSLAEVLTTTPNKGAVVAWASSGKTTPDLQEQMAIRFYNKLNEGNITKMGDLVKDAKSALVNYGTDVRLSWVLIGDPMLKLR